MCAMLVCLCVGVGAENSFSFSLVLLYGNRVSRYRGTNCLSEPISALLDELITAVSSLLLIDTDTQTTIPQTCLPSDRESILLLLLPCPAT